MFLLWLGSVFKHSIMTWFALLTFTLRGTQSGLLTVIVVKPFNVWTAKTYSQFIIIVHNARTSWCTYNLAKMLTALVSSNGRFKTY